jgi:hypothetical protein
MAASPSVLRAGGRVTFLELKDLDWPAQGQFAPVVQDDREVAMSRVFTYSTTAHTSVLASFVLKAGMVGCVRPFHIL